MLELQRIRVPAKKDSKNQNPPKPMKKTNKQTNHIKKINKREKNPNLITKLRRSQVRQSVDSSITCQNEKVVSNGHLVCDFLQTHP